MTRFREVSLSPYFNKHAGVQALIGYLSDKYPDFSAKVCAREMIWKKVFPKEEYNYPHLALLFTYSLRLLERFFAIEKLEARDTDAQFLTAEYLRERRLLKQYEKTQKTIEKQLNNAEFRDADYYFQKYLFANERDQKHLKITQKQEDDGLQEKQDSLDLWFMAMKLRDACEMKMRQRYFGKEYEAGLLSEILAKIKSQATDYQNTPAVFIYYLVYELLSNEAQADYFVLKEKVEKEAAYFSKSELQNFYNYLQNFCIQQINKGETTFLKEIFIIYQSQLERELIFDKKGTLAEWNYKNIVTAGLRSNAYDWVRNFIEDYKARLSPSVAENAYSFNLANYFFAVEKYRKVLPLLIQVEYSDMRYKLDARALLLRTYYHLKETEAFYALCDAFNQLLLRNKDLTDFQRTGYQNMIRMSRKVFAWHGSRNFVKKVDFGLEQKKLSNELEGLKLVFNAAWLRGELG